MLAMLAVLGSLAFAVLLERNVLALRKGREREGRRLLWGISFFLAKSRLQSRQYELDCCACISLSLTFWIVH